jgi:hypothetical protein
MASTMPYYLKKIGKASVINIIYIQIEIICLTRLVNHPTFAAKLNNGEFHANW